MAIMLIFVTFFIWTL